MDVKRGVKIDSMESLMNSLGIQNPYVCLNLVKVLH